MKYGLVLEGGAMRGMFTAGVIDILMEHNINFDGIAGVSAGAAFGCNYKSKQPRRVIRYNTRFCKNRKYCSFYSLITTGDIFGADFCYHKVPDELDVFDCKVFKENPMEFFAVCTDIETGKPVYHRCRDANYEEFEWIRASSSMPLVSRIVESGGKKLLDGGISDSIPLKFMEAIGYDKNIVVLTQPRDYIKKAGRSIGVIKRVYRKYPNLVRTYERRPEMYNEQLRYVRNSESEGIAFVIAPDEKLPIGHIEHNREVLLEVYRIGRKTALRQLNDIKKFLNE